MQTLDELQNDENANVYHLIKMIPELEIILIDISKEKPEAFDL